MKYKTGDKVRCVSTVGLGGSLSLGEIYTIADVNGELVYLKGEDSWYSYYFFKVINEEPAQKKPTFEIGDKVRCINANVRKRHSLQLGEVFTVDGVYESSITVSGLLGLFEPTWFERLKEKPVFKTGDIVRCINVEGPFGHLLQLGNIYTIDEVYESSVMVWGVINCLFEPNRFERIKEKLPKIQVGDIWAKKGKTEVVEVVGLFKRGTVKWVSYLYLSGENVGLATNDNLVFFRNRFPEFIRHKKRTVRKFKQQPKPQAKLVQVEDADTQWEPFVPGTDTLYVSGRKVKMEQLGCKGIATCHENDEFDVYYGVRLARAKWKVGYHEKELQQSINELMEVLAESMEKELEDVPYPCSWTYDKATGIHYSKCGYSFKELPDSMACPHYGGDIYPNLVTPKSQEVNPCRWTYDEDNTVFDSGCGFPYASIPDDRICPYCKKGIQMTPSHQKESEEDV